MITVLFNNTPQQLGTSSSLLDLMHENGLGSKSGIATALNGLVIPKSKWVETPLRNNDKILVITATQGG